MTDAPHRHRLRRLLIGLSAFAVIFYLGGGFYFSNVLNEEALDGAARRASLDPVYDLVVTDVAGQRITLSPEGDPGQLTDDGVFGLTWEGGYGQVGAILKERDGSVEREFSLVSGSPPSKGTTAELEVRAWPDPESAGVTSVDVSVETPLGSQPAWFVPGDRDAWAIVVHGNSTSRLDGLRMVPILADLGYPTLVISYRNDAGGPADPSGRLKYGLTEWEDLEASVRYVVEQGARRVVLIGYSMGGGVVMAFLQRSDLAGLVDAVILDAPMLDFSTTVDDNASRETLPVVGLPLPPSLTATAKWIADRRFDIGWDELDYLATPKRYRVPFLVFHGTADTTVPIATSEEFAELRPKLVTLVRCPKVEHIACWNQDPDAYAGRVNSFLGA
jgi:pimeloyl-ACP methyl ester carboxylesterase